MKKDKTPILLGILFSLLAILILIPFFYVGFTTGDDLENYLTARQGLSAIWAHTKDIARGAGRFYFYIAQPLYKLPYLVDSFLFTKLVQYLSLFLSYLLFTKLIYKIFQSKTLSQLVLLFLIVCTFISENQHVPIQAYPFIFSFSFSICIGAILLYIEYRQKQQRKYLWGSVSLFFVSSLFFETYLLFLLFFLVYLLIDYLQQFGIKRFLKEKNFWKDILPYAGAGLCYIIIYFGYRIYISYAYPDLQSYDGSTFATNFSFSHFLRIIYKCTTFVIPGQAYSYHHEMVSANATQLHVHDNVWFMLTHAPVQSYIAALLSGGLIFWLIKHNDFQKLQTKQLYIALPVTLFLAFSSHTLIGIAEKYNQDWWSWMHGYVTSYYAYFFIILFIAMIVAILFTLTNTRAILKKALTLVMVVLTAFFTLLISHANNNLSRGWEQSQNRFTILDHVIHSHFFDHVEDDAILYTASLYEHIHYWAFQITGYNNLVDQYICIKSHRNLHCAKSLEEFETLKTKFPEAPIYYFYYAIAPKTNETKLSITRIAPQEIPIADVYYHSPHKSYTLFVESTTECTALIEGTYEQTFSPGINAINIVGHRLSTDVTHVRIEAEGLSPEEITVGNIFFPKGVSYKLPRQRKP